MLEVDIEALASMLFPDSRPQPGRASANGFELFFSFSLKQILHQMGPRLHKFVQTLGYAGIYIIFYVLR